MAAHQGDEAIYNQLWSLERQTDLQEEKIRLLSALSRFKQAEFLEETLRRSLTDQVRAQDAVSVIIMVASNRYGHRLAWDFVKKNLERIRLNARWLELNSASLADQFST